MKRRLTTIATLLFAACTENGSFPTEVVRQQNIDERTTVPPIVCSEYLVDDPSSIGVPGCVIAPPWSDSALYTKARHEYEQVTATGASGGGGGAGRSGNRSF